MRWASPPDSVGLGWALKKSTASSTLSLSTSPICLPQKVTASVSGVKRSPLQTSQGTETSGRKFISTRL